MPDEQEDETPRSKRGFAAMHIDKHREIARLGGRAAHAQGTAHEFTPDEARAAGQKGGQRVKEKYGSPHFSKIGRAGGKKSSGKRLVQRDGGEQVILDRSDEGNKLNALDSGASRV
ncbi:MAG: stress-induced protein [Patescibacteria group bacterium]